MKNIFIITCFLFLGTNLFAQTAKNSSLIDSLKKPPRIYSNDGDYDTVAKKRNDNKPASKKNRNMDHNNNTDSLTETPEDRKASSANQQ
jgi:hypothetical protein